MAEFGVALVAVGCGFPSDCRKTILYLYMAVSELLWSQGSFFFLTFCLQASRLINGSATDSNGANLIYFTICVRFIRLNVAVTAVQIQKRRERIAERVKALQQLLPNSFEVDASLVISDIWKNGPESAYCIIFFKFIVLVFYFGREVKWL